MRVSAKSSGQPPHRVDRGTLGDSEVSAAQLGFVSLPWEAPSPCGAGRLQLKAAQTKALSQPCHSSEWCWQCWPPVGAVGGFLDKNPSSCTRTPAASSGRAGPQASPDQHFGLGMVTQSQVSPQHVSTC